MSASFDWVSLDEDEEVLWSGEPLLKSIYSAIVFGIILIPVFGIGLLIILGSYLYIKHTDFLVSSEGIYRKTGVLSRQVKKIDYNKVQNISFSQGFFGKMFDYGNVEISTAGGSGVEMRFNAIENPRKVQELINKKIQDEERKGNSREKKSDVMEQLLSEIKKMRETVEEINQKL